MYDKKDNLTKVIFISWLTTIIALSIMFIIFSIYYKYNDFEGASSSLNRVHIESYNKILKSNVKNNLKFLDYIFNKMYPKGLSSDSNIVEVRDKVLSEYAKIDPVNPKNGTVFILSLDNKVLSHSHEMNTIGKKLTCKDINGENFFDGIIRWANHFKGKSFIYYRDIDKYNRNMKIYCYAQKYKKLNVIVCSEIPYDRLDAAIAMNLNRLKINIYLEMGFASIIVSLIIILTVFYIYRLSKSIKLELSSIIHFFNNVHDEKINNSFSPDKFTFKEFAIIGNAAQLMVKQVKKLLNKLGEKTLASEAISQSKTSLFTGISHDFIVELNTIMGMSQILMNSESSQEDREKLSKIYHSASHITSIIRNIEATQLFNEEELSSYEDKFNLEKLFEGAIRFVEPEAKDKNIKVIYDHDDSIPQHCIGDSVRIRQLIINILGNIIAYLVDGEIDITLQIKTSEEKQKFIFIAKDNGDGFLGSELDEILSFPNAREKFSMMSLRIAVCHDIAKKLKGSFMIESEKGEGTVYKLELPLEISDEINESAIDLNKSVVADLGNEESKSEKSILVVEDDPANLDLISTILDSFGYKTSVAKNGKEAVEKFDSEFFDLILMDCQMPVMNGFKATQVIREREGGKDVCIIALSGLLTHNDKNKWKDAGMDDFISKPFEIMNLLNVIGDAILSHKS